MASFPVSDAAGDDAEKGVRFRIDNRSERLEVQRVPEAELFPEMLQFITELAVGDGNADDLRDRGDFFWIVPVPPPARLFINYMEVIVERGDRGSGCDRKRSSWGCFW